MSPIPIGSHLDMQGTSRIQNLPDATAPQEPVTLAQHQADMEGLKTKPSVRVASTGNINLTAPGASINGVTMAMNDRFLAKNQTTGSQNGIYVWNGAATPATRAADANTWTELQNALVGVNEGTVDSGTWWRQSSITGTLDTTTITWVPHGVVAPAATEATPGIAEVATQAETDTGTDNGRFVTPQKLANWAGRSRSMSQLIGDGTSTSFTVTHNFNTRNVVVTVNRNSGNYEEILVETRRITVNAVELVFASAPASNAFNVTVTKG